MALLEGLNEVQREAAAYTEGPSMIIAGAGSGKTRVLTYKIAHLIEKGVDPFNIMSLTFTNKAAREMKERIESIIGTKARSVWMGTFHSVFSKILRIEAEKIGYPSNFTIYDSDDSKSIIRKIIKEEQLDDKVYKPNIVLGRISSAKNNLISAADYNNNPTLMSTDRESGKGKIGQIYITYQQRLKRASAMDFDDLLFNTNVLLRDNPDVLIKYQRRFRYFLVDEYQDTNHSQYLIVKRLAAQTENLTVVGDDAQSIYAFRGANIKNILNMNKDYNTLKTFKLEQNYRSTQNIVNIANAIIGKNQKQIEKTIWTSNDVGDKIQLNSCLSDSQEGSLVARNIFSIKNNEQAKDSDFAILYRTNSQSRAMEDSLRKMNIPYRIHGGLSFYSRKEIKDLLAYYRLVINHNDEEALMRVINYPKRGIGDTSMDKIRLEANRLGMSLWDMMCNINTNSVVARGTAVKIDNFVNMIRTFELDLHSKNAYELANEIAKKSGIFSTLFAAREDQEGVMRFENVEELLAGIKEFTEEESDELDAVEMRTLSLFMEDIALHTDADKNNTEDQDTVTLMTIHASKGLEFPYVFIVGLEENLFPSMMSLTSRADIEEERRLFYVALTRGEKKVFLSYAGSRYKWGNLQYSEPSRFISELDSKYVDDNTSDQILASGNTVRGYGSTPSPKKELKSFASKAKPKSKINSRKEINIQTNNKNLKRVEKKVRSGATNNQENSIREGMEVFHDRFGRGKVLTIEGPEGDRKASVNFANSGTKTLILKFAKLRILKQ
ncbi:MAG: ATP-dependent DNA helicase [Bacteroidetes bacterium 4572_112]|nr:MAG: ATP-dependent DNA helicase [Bacteroidetes bacterium 4572_112]